MTIKKITPVKKAKISSVKAKNPSLFYACNDETFEDLKNFLNYIVDELHNEIDSFYLTINDYTLSFYITELPHCCGVYEIGDISISNQKFKEFPKKEFDQVLNTIFENFDYTLITNLVSKNSPSSLFIESFKTSKYFTLVKTFVNKNTKNEIQMFISNYK